MKKRFIKKIWKKLSLKSQKSICQELQIPWQDQPEELFKEGVCVGIAFLAMKELDGKIRYKYLRAAPFVNIVHLNHDRHGWGARREKNGTIGLFQEIEELKEDEKDRLEWSLKSTLTMNLDAKIYFIESAATMEPSVLRGFIAMVESEMSNIDRRFRDTFDTCYRDEGEAIRQKIKERVKEWKEIEKRYIQDKKSQPYSDKDSDLLPYKILEELRQYVIGQDEALTSVVTALYYQKKIVRALLKNQEPPFEPFKPILLSGQTGSGKTYLIRKACELMDIPYVIVDASSMVSTGIRGMSIDELVKTLIRKCGKNMDKARGAVVVFDEIDKLTGGDLHYGEAVMSQLLRFVEGGEYSIEKSNGEEISEFAGINSLRTDYMLFIFAGSFQKFYESGENISGFIKNRQAQHYGEYYHQLIEESGMKRELLGRIGEIVILNPMDKESLIKILTESKDSPLLRYRKMLSYNNVEYHIDQKSLEAIAQEAQKSGYGARGLEKLLYDHFKKILFLDNVRTFVEFSPEEAQKELIKRLEMETL